jgi:electron transfer flavoprotein alpha subunit
MDYRSVDGAATDTVLFLVHTDEDGALPRVALETLRAAADLARAVGGAPVVAGLVGGDVEAAAERLGACDVARVLVVSGPDFRTSRYSSDAIAAEAICRHAAASLVLAPHTSRWARVLPGVACRLGGRIDTHAISVGVTDGAPFLTRWFYRQRIEGVVQRTTRPWVMLVDPGSYEAWDGPAGRATVETVSVCLPEAGWRTSVSGQIAPSSDERTIRPDADLLLVAGAGWTKKQRDGRIRAEEAEHLIADFLRLAGASLGGSKSVVELRSEGQAALRCMTHLNQVGQTGSTPRHRKGLATCCHGEEPHVVGWRFISERRAVNTDPNCGWARGKADVLYVADAFAVMRQVNELLSRRKQP